MHLPEHIPTGTRIVVRTQDGNDDFTGRPQFRDFVGHVTSWDGTTLRMIRDAAANGSRPECNVEIDASRIVRIKPVPERKLPASGALSKGV